MRDMRVIVIGNCTVDLSFSIPRFPRAGETLLADEKFVDLGGKGANQAVVAARFGAQTVLAAPIGCDAEGDWARSRLEVEGLASDTLLRVESLTDQSIIYVAPGGENCIVSTHRAAAAASPEWAAGILSRYARRDDILLMQGNLALETTRAALEAARRFGMTTILNPAPIQYPYDSLLSSTDIVILNEIEATQLGERDDPIASGQAIRVASSVPYVIVTLGSHGAVLISDEGLVPVPAPMVAAVDTVGAGDTLCGAFAAALARGTNITSALRISIVAASLAVTRKGSQSSFPTAVEAAAIFARHQI
jgi:ribokinase